MRGSDWVENTVDLLWGSKPTVKKGQVLLQLLVAQTVMKRGPVRGLQWYSGKSPATLVIHCLFPAVEVVGSNSAPPIQ